MKIIKVVLLLLLFAGCSNQMEEDSSQLLNSRSQDGVRVPSENNLAEITDDSSSIEDKQNQEEKGNRENMQRQQVKTKQILDVPLIKQNPELKYGCEITSLTMLLKYAGFDINKLQLAKEMPKDNDKLVKNRDGNITRWGNPDEGFVGDVTGKNAGYAIFDKPLETVMRKYLGEKTVNLTGKPFDSLISQVNKGRPVIVWTTGDYKLPDRWESWQHGKDLIKTPLDLHAVVLVGYDENHVYLNDPLSGLKAVKANKETFIESWKALKKRALSYN